MNFLNKLLNNQKVEWKTLGEVCEIVTDFTAAGSFASNAKNVTYLQNPDYALLVRTTDIKQNFKNEKDFVYIDEHAFNYLWRVNLDKNSIILPNVGNCGEIYYINPEDLPYKKCVLGPNALLARSDTSLLKFLYYWFVSNNFQKELSKITSKAGQNKFNKTNLKTIKIPPLQVQHEIVRILDKFTSLEKALEKELTLRQKQYRYYRDKLLNFDDNDNVKWTTLGEVCENLDAKRKPITSNYREKGDIPYYGASGIVDHVKDYIFDGDYLLISEDGANLVSRHYPIAFSINGKTWVNNHAHVLKFDNYATRKFIEYYINNIDISSFVSSGAQPKLNKTNLNKIPIPLPPLSEQERIVGILDKFDKLVNSISEGLPREIELRRKQYEYYRNELLNFEQ